MTLENLIVILLLFIQCSACQQNEQASIYKTTSASEAPSSVVDRKLDTLVPKANLAVAKTVEPAGSIEQEILIDYDTSKWSELIQMDTAFVLDIKYATEDNFVEEQLYDCPRCFMRPVAAAALQKIHELFKAQGLRIKLLDCYRPAPVQQRLWDKVPNASYVTPPSKGSMHNRGLAVDLTLVDSKGKELDMGTTYDFFGRKAHHTHKDLPEEVLNNRRLLKKTMEANGFKSIRTEWWHYSYVGKRFKIDDMEWDCE